MNEYKLLIPLQRDGDNLPHSTHEWTQLRRTLLDTFGGYTIGGPVVGSWRAPDGSEIHDTSTPVYVAAASELAVVELAQQIAANFDQQCVYVRFPNGSVRLIPGE